MIYLLGGNGQLGYELRRKLGDNIVVLDRSQFDLADVSLCHRNLKNLKAPSVIINAAAYTAVDAAENDRERCLQINAHTPAMMAEESRRMGCKFFHFSSDYVFNGASSVPYVESDAKEPLNFYGESKNIGEELILAANPNSVIFRTSWLYSASGKNFVKTMLKLGEERSEIRVVFDQVGTLTSAKDLAEVVLKSFDLEGIYHFTNEGVCSWYDVVCNLKKSFKLKAKILPIRSSSYPTPARRPAYSVLDKTKIKSALSIEIDHWSVSLDRFLNDELKQE